MAIVANILSIEVQKKIRILSDIQFSALSGQVTTIMGPSGSGKSTLMAFLACRISNTDYKIEGQNTINGKIYDADDFKNFGSFVQQDDYLWATLTVRQSLAYIAKLKGKSTEKVNSILADLLLIPCQDFLVGGELHKSISGGQKKRLAIGMELLSDPKVLLLDQPTSGLDSYNALQLMKILKNLSRQGKTIIQTIHQPSSYVFSMFDRLTVLKQGQLIFQDQAGKLLPYMKELGLKISKRAVPCQILMQQLSDINITRDYQSPINNQNFRLHYKKPDIPQQQMFFVDNSFSSGFLQQAFTLFVRGLKIHFRNPLTYISIFLTTAVTVVLMLALYKDLANDRPLFPNFTLNLYYFKKVGGYLFMSMFVNFGSSNFQSVMRIPSQRLVVTRECASGTYSPISFLITDYLIILPLKIIHCLIYTSLTFYFVGINLTWQAYMDFLLVNFLMCIAGLSYGGICGALCRDSVQAISLQVLTTVPVMIFGGYLVGLSTLGAWIKWLSYLSPLRYGFIYLTKTIYQNQTFYDEFGNVMDPSRLMGIEEGGLGLEPLWLGVLGVSIFCLSVLAFKLRTKASF